ncbi:MULTISPECIES: site-specific integrase [Caproicibacterium]|nr:site-specific integrase [Caproicibacterium lactatifermentans]
MNSFHAQRIINSLADKYSKSTLNEMRVIFHQSFEAASQIPSMHVNRIGKMRIPDRASQKHVRALTRAEQEAVEEAAQHVYMGYLAIFFLRTGLRSAELCNLKWQDFNEKRRMIFVRKSKTPSGVRFIPLRNEALQIILMQPKNTAVIMLFFTRSGMELLLQHLYCRIVYAFAQRNWH